MYQPVRGQVRSALQELPKAAISACLAHRLAAFGSSYTGLVLGIYFRIH